MVDFSAHLGLGLRSIDSAPPQILRRALRGMVVVVSLVPLLVGAQTQRPTDAELVHRVQAYFAPFAAHELSGTLLVARGDRVLLEQSFGFANHELGVPSPPTTPKNVAPITKPLTIIITSQLAEAKRLSVTDTVSKWVPEYVY